MKPTPESSSPHQQSGRTSDFEAGLNAFQQEDYATAVLLLEPALNAPLQPLVIRAQMALTIAYEKLGETPSAVEICQLLQQVPNSQTQAWAARTLVSLLKRHPELSSLAEPTPDQHKQTSQIPEIPNSQKVEFGFVPLEDNSSQASTPPIPPTISARSKGVSPTLHPAVSSQATQPSASVDLPLLGEQTPPTDPDTTVVQSPHTDERPSTEAIPTTPTLYQPVWRNAERAQQWKPLGKVKVLRLLAVQAITAIALIYSIQQFLHAVFTIYSTMLIRTLPRLGFRVDAPEIPTWPFPFTVILLLILLIGSRWVIDVLLTVLYGMKPLSLNALSTYSSETARSLNRFCRKAGVPMPALGVLPMRAPIAFTYGVVPQVSRTIVSQGLLEQLEDDEIATIYANEVAHLSYWTVPLMSMALGALLTPYTLYQIASEWGNRKQAIVTKISASFISVFSYGLFWLLRWLPLWLSRQRVYYSDRMASELTGNPNGYTRALLKIAIGTATDVENQSKTDYCLEAFEIVTPIGYRMATFLGSLYPHRPLEPVLEWDRTNALRHVLALNNSHPPTGERLHLLTLYARHWKLTPELDWDDPPVRQPKSAGFTRQQWQTLLLQGAPYNGCLAGILLAFALIGIGWIGDQAGWAAVSWIVRDQTLLFGFPLIGICLGTLLRINPFFPDISPKSRHSLEEENLLFVLLSNPQMVPIHTQTVHLEGKLLGRSGVANLLNQDLLLQTNNGIFKLHCTSRLGPFGAPFSKPIKPGDVTQQSIKMQGWFHRGVTPWIDVETIQTVKGRSLRSYHPVWALVLAAFMAVCGILIILNI